MGRSLDGDFINLLPSVTMMSPSDSKLGFHKTGKRQFGTSNVVVCCYVDICLQLSETWSVQ